MTSVSVAEAKHQPSMVLRMPWNWKDLFVTAVNPSYLVIEECAAFLRKVGKDTSFRIQLPTLECMLLIWIPLQFICCS